MGQLYFWSMIFTASMSLSLALFFKSEAEPQLNKSWRFFMLAFVIWSVGRGISFTVANSWWALFWIRMAYCGSIWLAPLWTWLSLEILHQKISRKAFYSTVIIYGIFTVLNFTPYFIPIVSPKLNFRYYDDNPGWAFNLWSIIFSFYAIGIHIHLYREIKKAEGLIKNRIRWIFLAGILGFGGSASTFPLVNDIPVYPFAVPIVALSPLILTYAVVRYQLMDLYLVLRDTSVHLISSLIIALIFVSIAGSQNNLEIYAVCMILMAIMIPLFYPILSRWVRKNINRTRLGDVDRYLSDIEEKSQGILNANLSMNSLSKELLVLIQNIFPVGNIWIYFYKSKNQSLFKYASIEETPCPQNIEKNSGIFKELQDISEPLSSDQKLNSKFKNKAVLFKMLDDYHAQVLSPIFISNQLSGLLVFGEKISKAAYHHKDIEAIEYITKKAVTACSYTTAVEKYAVAMQEWTHSLNQITKPIEMSAGLIKGMFDILPRKDIDEALDIIIKRTMQLRSVHEYISNSSAITREVATGEYKKEIKNISQIVTKATELFYYENKNTCSLTIDGKTAMGYINETSIERVIGEIISNALRHTNHLKENARIEIKSEIIGENYHVLIKDNGDGIDSNLIDKIWEPGWQQKDVNTGASGLGLAICKQVIEAHDGHISAKSAGKNMGMEISFDIPILRREN